MADNQQLLALDVGQSGSRISINGELKSIQRAMHAGEPVENTVAAILENLCKTCQNIDLIYSLAFASSSAVVISSA